MSRHCSIVLIRTLSICGNRQLSAYQPVLFTRLVLGNLAAWAHGSSIVYASESFNAQSILQALEKERCTGVHGVPTHFLGLLGEIARAKKAGKEWDLSSLRYLYLYGRVKSLAITT